MTQNRVVLVAGATGYIGGRLAPMLLERGWRVRALARSLDKLACRPWAGHERAELHAVDGLDQEGLARAMDGAEAAIYLIHSLAHGPDFASRDRAIARAFARAAAQAGVGRILYLGGLGRDQDELSEHLRSRREVEHILAQGEAPVTTIRCGMVIGSGSASFELVRYVAERFPVIVAGSWLRTLCAPVAVTDVLESLAGCLERDETIGATFGLCGPEVVSYEEVFHLYCQVAGLPRRPVVLLPLLSPSICARLVGLLAPLPRELAQPLFEGLGNEVVCHLDSVRTVVPLHSKPLAATLALARQSTLDRLVDSCWADAGGPRAPEWATCGDASWGGGTMLELGYRVRVEASPEAAFAPIEDIGGQTGWYYADYLWWLRGLMDKLVGGVGLGRGRKAQGGPRVGDAVDFWRVAAIERPRRLVLYAEMRAPGEAVLTFEVEPVGDTGQSEIRVRARFLPRGLLGLAYWYAVHPLHGILFTGLMRRLARGSGGRITLGPELVTPYFPSTCRLPQAGAGAGDQGRGR